jgi:crotonobetainyl-CoA:carnitine CoA-transferase CaiB-like acyl-CoA transferase
MASTRASEFMQTPGMGTLNGIRVVEAGTMITAPLAAMMLGDQGADVIKVEAPGMGDVMRTLGERRSGVSALWATCNRSKRSLAIDLHTEEGRDTALALIDTADVFIQNFRPGVLDRLGIGEQTARARNRRLIYVSIAGFGFVGPRANHPAYDNIIQSVSGIAASQTDPRTGQPSLLRNLVSDKITAYTVAQAVTSALFHRERTGEGQHLEIAMVDATLAFLWPDAMMGETFLDRDEDLSPGPVIGHTYNLMEAHDGHFGMTALTDLHFGNLMKAIGKPDLATDPRLNDVGGRITNQELWRTPLGEWVSTRNTDEIVGTLIEFGVPAGKVVAIADVHRDPQIVANETLIEHDHPHFGRMREPRPAVRFSASPAAMSRPAPLLGEHNAEILAELGRS